MLSEELSVEVIFFVDFFWYTAQKWLFHSQGEIFLLMTGQACEFLLVMRLIAFHVPLDSLLFVRMFSKNFFLGIADHAGDFILVSFIFIKAI